MTIKRKAFKLGRRPLIAKQHRHFGNAELARCLQPQVRIYNLAFVAGKHGILEPNSRMLPHI